MKRGRWKGKADFERDVRNVIFALKKIRPIEYAFWVLVSLALGYVFFPLSERHAPESQQVPIFAGIFFFFIITMRVTLILSEASRKWYPEELRQSSFRYKRRNLISRHNFLIYLVVAFLIMISAIDLVPVSTINFLELGSYETSTISGSVFVVFNSETYSVSGQLSVHGFGAISVDNPLTLTIVFSDWTLPANTSTILFFPNGAYNTTLQKFQNGESGYVPASIPITYSKSSGYWSATAQVVYVDPDISSNGSVELLAGSGVLSNFPVQYSFPVADESVTGQIVSNSVEIFLTVVIIAFVILEFRTTDGDKKTEEYADHYIRKGVAG